MIKSYGIIKISYVDVPTIRFYYYDCYTVKTWSGFTIFTVELILWIDWLTCLDSHKDVEREYIERIGVSDKTVRWSCQLTLSLYTLDSCLQRSIFCVAWKCTYIRMLRHGLLTCSKYDLRIFSLIVIVKYVIKPNWRPLLHLMSNFYINSMNVLLHKISLDGVCNSSFSRLKPWCRY